MQMAEIFDCSLQGSSSVQTSCKALHVWKKQFELTQNLTVQEEIK